MVGGSFGILALTTWDGALKTSLTAAPLRALLRPALVCFGGRDVCSSGPPMTLRVPRSSHGPTRRPGPERARLGSLGCWYVAPPSVSAFALTLLPLGPGRSRFVVFWSPVTTGGRSVSSRHARTALALPPAVSGSSPAAERLSHVFSGHRGACGVPLGPAAQCADAFAQAAAAASPRASRCVRVAFRWLSFQGGLVLRLFLWIANVQNTLVFCLYNLKDRSVGYKTGVIISFLRTCGFRFECCHGNI